MGAKSHQPLFRNKPDPSPLSRNAPWQRQGQNWISLIHSLVPSEKRASRRGSSMFPWNFHLFSLVTLQTIEFHCSPKFFKAPLNSRDIPCSLKLIPKKTPCSLEINDRVPLYPHNPERPSDRKPWITFAFLVCWNWVQSSTFLCWCLWICRGGSVLGPLKSLCLCMPQSPSFELAWKFKSCDTSWFVGEECGA